MKKFILVLAFLLLAQTAFADVVVIYNSSDRSVYSISNQDDATLPQGYTKEVLKMNLEDIQLPYHWTLYKYQEGKFVADLEKIKKEVDAQVAAQENAKKETLIREKIRAMAEKELKLEGKLK